MKKTVSLWPVCILVLLASCSPGEETMQSSVEDLDVGFRLPSLPEAVGPITGPGEMYVADVETLQPEPLSAFDYGLEEYFVSGTAADKSYTTRILIISPTDASRNSGQVFVENNHAQNRPLVWRYSRDYNLSRGHTWVSVSTTTGNGIAHLRNINPDRYSHLQLDDDQILDLYAQIARLIKSDVSPVPEVDRLYLTAFSMAERPLPPFMESRHANFRIDGGAPLYDAYFLPPSRTASGMGPLPDVDVPVIQINSQLEVAAIFVDEGIDYRKPDSDDLNNPYRLYEVAGMPHIDSRYTPMGSGQSANHPGVLEPCDNPLNRFPNDRLVSTAMDHLIRWVNNGILPPHQSPISVIGGAGGQIELDAFGNAVGGVRHSYVDIPVSTHTAGNTGPDSVNCLVYGSQIPFSVEQLENLYDSREDYVSRVGRRLDELVEEGWLLEEYADEFKEEAAEYERIQSP